VANGHGASGPWERLGNLLGRVNFGRIPFFGRPSFFGRPFGTWPASATQPGIEMPGYFRVTPLTGLWFGSLARVETNERKDLAAVFLPAPQSMLPFSDGDFIA
jgi:hypothetical protein